MASPSSQAAPALLVAELHGLEIYASCAIAIYFYELVVYGLIKCIKWYKSQSWSIPEVICISLEKFTTLAYCIITLILLHFTSHTQFSCALLLLLQQGFFAISTAFHCSILLIRFRAFYPNRPYSVVMLFLVAVMITLFQIINVLGFSKVEVNKLGGNCYVLGDNEFFPIGFIIMMIYSWIIWASIGVSIYSRRNSYHKRYWRRILFDNGFMYLSLIAASQAINIIFILNGKDYMSKFVNVTPLLVLTSICAQKLIVNTKSFDKVEKGITFRSFTFVNEKNVVSPQQESFTQPRKRQQSLGTFIDQFYIQEQGYPQQQQVPNLSNQQDYPQQSQQQDYQQNQNQQYYPPQQNQEYVIKIPSPTYSSFSASTTTSTKVNSVPPSLPPIIIHKKTTSDIEEEEEEEEESNSYSEYDNSPLTNSSERKTRDFGSFLLDYFNNISLSTPTSASHDSVQYGHRISKINRLSNLKVNTPHLSLNNRISQGMRKSQQGQQGIIVDPNDIYYFTYSSDDDNEVYLFPAIQIHSDPNNSQVRTSIPFDNNNIRQSNELLTPSIHHQSFAFAGRIIADNNDDNSLADSIDNKKVVIANDAQDILSKKHSMEEYIYHQEDE